jgi:hypothetical protein
MPRRQTLAARWFSFAWLYLFRFFQSHFCCLYRRLEFSRFRGFSKKFLFRTFQIKNGFLLATLWLAFEPKTNSLMETRKISSLQTRWWKSGKSQKVLKIFKFCTCSGKFFRLLPSNSYFFQPRWAQNFRFLALSTFFTHLLQTRWWAKIIALTLKVVKSHGEFEFQTKLRLRKCGNLQNSEFRSKTSR